MDKIVECVPNFSEGKNQKTISEISSSISSTPGCRLLDVDAGASTNRTVFTFVGSPDSIICGALNAAKTAYQLIDMSDHRGEHPRFGAMDVCPFIPIRNVTMEECVEIANKFADILATELKIPIYLYGYAAKEEKRKLLPNIRKGEYEKLPEKLKDADWKPDYGPANFNARWGASAVGARKFLMAYNVNLMCTKEQANKIAFNIRERGRGEGKRGRLKCVQAIGWYLRESDICQVSTNITDCDVTKLHQVFEEVKKDAKEYNLPLLGSEIIGMVPLDLLLEAADYYIAKDNLMVLKEEDRVELARHYLGLNYNKNFLPNERVIEYAIKEKGIMTSQSLNEYIGSISERSETPGGGSVSAAVASMGAALGCMVGQLSYGKKKWEEIEEIVRKNLKLLHKCCMNLIPMIDEDCCSFNEFFQALKMTEKTDEDKIKKENAKQQGIMKALKTPLRVMEEANTSWEPLMKLAIHGNINCLSDIQVGAKCLHTGIWGAFQNVLINLPQLKNEEIKCQVEEKGTSYMKRADENLQQILLACDERKK